MRYVVIDSSVAFKLLLAYGEAGIDEAWALLGQHRARELLLVSPEVGFIEIANILRYIGVDAASADGLLKDYESLGIEPARQSATRVRAACNCAFEHGISLYDAMFLALAQELDCELVTSDRRAFGRIPAGAAHVRLI